MLKENFQISEQSSYMVSFSHSYSDDKREGESVPLKPGIHAEEKMKAKTEVQSPSFQGNSFAEEGKVLEDEVFKWSLIELKTRLNTFIKLVASEGQYVRSVEIIGRRGPAPGFGLGWGAHGGRRGGYSAKEPDEFVRLLQP